MIHDFDKERFPRTWDALQFAVSDGVAPGAVAGLFLASEPETFCISAIGNRRVVPSALPICRDTVFDLASLTKVFATATLAALLVERRWISWETKVSAVFPDYPWREIRLRHLLSHTAGFVAWEPFWQKLRERFVPRALHAVPITERQAEMRKLVFACQPDAGPGEKAVYSDISFLLLGFVLEEVTKTPLDLAVKRLLWDAMGIKGAYFNRITKSGAKRVFENVAATENCPWRGGVLQGQVHDDNCWAMGGYAGHAGAFATAEDVLFFAKSLLGGFLTRETLGPCWSRVSSPLDCERTLGWDTPSGPDPAAGVLFSRNSVGHLGFTGTSLWIDLDASLAVVLLTNRVHPSRENNKIKAFRSVFHRALREDLRSTG